MYVLVFSILFLSACKNNKNQGELENPNMAMVTTTEHNHSSKDETSKSENKNITAETQKNSSLSSIINSYLAIKNALTADNREDAVAGGKLMLAAFNSFDMTQLTGDQHEEYMDIVENSKEQLEHIVKSPIDHQREHFENLSIDLNDLISLLGTDKVLFQDFCPMAAEGKGAIWISELEEIKNPYLGSKMLTCGKVQKKIN